MTKSAKWVNFRDQQYILTFTIYSKSYKLMFLLSQYTIQILIYYIVRVEPITFLPHQFLSFFFFNGSKVV